MPIWALCSMCLLARVCLGLSMHGLFDKYNNVLPGNVRWNCTPVARCETWRRCWWIITAGRARELRPCRLLWSNCIAMYFSTYAVCAHTSFVGREPQNSPETTLSACLHSTTGWVKDKGSEFQTAFTYPYLQFIKYNGDFCKKQHSFRVKQFLSNMKLSHI